MIGKGSAARRLRTLSSATGGLFRGGGRSGLIARCIRAAEVIAFDELGCESVKKITVEDFPLTVAMDSTGGNLFRSGRAEYAAR